MVIVPPLVDPPCDDGDALAVLTVLDGAEVDSATEEELSPSDVDAADVDGDDAGVDDDVEPTEFWALDELEQAARVPAATTVRHVVSR